MSGLKFVVSPFRNRASGKATVSEKQLYDWMSTAFNWHSKKAVEFARAIIERGHPDWADLKKSTLLIREINSGMRDRKDADGEPTIPNKPWFESGKFYRNVFANAIVGKSAGSTMGKGKGLHFTIGFRKFQVDRHPGMDSISLANILEGGSKGATEAKIDFVGDGFQFGFQENKPSPITRGVRSKFRNVYGMHLPEQKSEFSFPGRPIMPYVMEMLGPRIEKTLRGNLSKYVHRFARDMISRSGFPVTKNRRR